MKSIKIQIAVLVSAMVFFVSISLGFISCILNFQSAMEVMEETLTDTAAVAANQVTAELRSYTNIASETGYVARLTNNSTSLSDKREIIEQRVASHNFYAGDVIDKNGKSIFDPSVDVSQEDYFKKALQGSTYISDPVIDKNGKIIVVVSAPLWKDGNSSSTVEGVVCYTPKPGFLNDIVNTINIGEHGNAYLLDSKGTSIAYYDESIVTSRYNTVEEAQKDSSLLPLARLEQRMVNGEAGFGTYSYGGIAKVMAFCPVSGSNGWSITVTAGRQEFIGGVYRSIYTTIFIVVLAMAAGILVALMAGKRIADPIIACTHRIRLLAEGDLHSDLPQVKRKDETAVLAKATETIVHNLSGIIQDISWGLGEMANGNFTADSRAKELYIGDFQPMAESMYKIIERLTKTLSQVRDAAEQVSSGSDQVSAGAQALSQGTTEQASSIEELAATINDISGQVNQNASDAIQANEKAAHTGKQLQESKQRMQEMVEAMNAISNSSGEIGKIIKVIEDIAFQTNILALNAAVEAARAGTAGKGFAVVADEVRNLAGKSAEASGNTSLLIADSLRAVENGTKIADETAKALIDAVENAQDVTEAINRITAASNEQAASLDQVTQGIDQISSVVQTNSATAEESAAASEELSGQAQMLRELAERFRLK